MSKSSASLFQPTDEWLTRRVVLIGLFIAIAAFYIVTLPANHSEAIDGYEYAYRAEAFSITRIEDTRSILFSVVNKLLFQASEVLGLGLRSLPILLAFGILTGTASVLLMIRLLRNGFGLSPLASISGGAFLALSYGFWRYTGESEVYVPSVFLILMSLNLLFNALADEHPRLQSLILAAVVAGIAALYYQPNVVPFLAVSVLMLSRRRFPSLIAFGAIGSAVVAGGIIAAYLVEKGPPVSASSLFDFVTNRAEEFRSHPFNIKTLLVMAQAIFHTLFTTNWLFGIDAVADWLKRVYPTNAIAPKVMAAESFQPFVYFAIPLLVLLVGVILRMVSLSFSSFRRQAFDQRSLFCVVWFALLFAIIAFLDPTSREPWIMASPPLIILFSIYVFEPLARKGHQNLIGLFLSTLLLYNFFGGMGMIQSAKGDFQYARTAWLRENISSGDAMLFGEQFDFRRLQIYLMYTNNPQVYIYPPKEGGVTKDVSQAEFIQSIMDTVREAKGRVFVLGEFFVNDWELLRKSWRNEERIARAKSFVERVRGSSKLVDSGPLGAVFELEPPPR